jgi:hypothetical protein
VLGSTYNNYQFDVTRAVDSAQNTRNFLALCPHIITRISYTYVYGADINHERGKTVGSSSVLLTESRIIILLRSGRSDDFWESGERGRRRVTVVVHQGVRVRTRRRYDKYKIMIIRRSRTTASRVQRETHSFCRHTFSCPNKY